MCPTEAKQLLFSPRVLPMDAYDVANLPEEAAAVFIVATAGQGEFPGNAQGFWRFLLRKSLPPNSLSRLKFAVFGLGDSGYSKYNVAAKKLDARLGGLGASPLLERGLGDDQAASGYEAVLDRWLPEMWGQLRAAFPLPPGVPQPQLDEQADLQLGAPKYKLVFLPRRRVQPPSASDALYLAEAMEAAAAFRRVSAQAAGSGLASRQQPACEERTGSGCSSGPSAPAPAAGSYGPWRPFAATVLANRRLTAPGHFQDVRHIELSLSGSGMEGYQPGDVVCVLPRPEPDAVEAFLGRMGLEGEQEVQIEAADAGLSSIREVATISVRALVEGVIDVAGASPRRRLFQVLGHFTPGEAELQRERLHYFASAEGRDDLYRYNQREGRTLLEVLQDFSSSRPPLEWLLEAGPLNKPRQFSISSSARLHPGEAHLTVAVVEWTTPFKRKRRGLCSTYLASRVPAAPSSCLTAPAATSSRECALEAGTRSDCVAVWVQPGTLRMPGSPAVPLVLVGPGTGIAPFRAFLEERAAWIKAAAEEPSCSTLPPAPCCLFFGCRSLAADCMYLEQWLAYQGSGVLRPDPVGLVVAASRDQAEKVYVTHKIREHGAAVWDLVARQGAAVYVSGSAQKMPADVAAAFEDVAVDNGGLSREEARQYIRHLELKGRYKVEAW